ncbi:MAG: hypothetical protein U9Q77_04390 [Candidatus Marinimicrobia bacterium]|nr:hypothetical protein [Candidatus Neomarinimicrobiota bacterium]
MKQVSITQRHQQGANWLLVIYLDFGFPENDLANPDDGKPTLIFSQGL